MLLSACLQCRGDTEQGLLCGGCWAALPWNSTACQRCALPLPDPAQSLCRACAHTAPPQSRAQTALIYDETVSPWLLAFKFQRKLELGHSLAAMLSRQLRRRTQPLPELLLPIPLHGSRLRARGYNQSGILTRHLGQQLCIPLREDLLIRSRATAIQSRAASAAARRRNLAGAFDGCSSLEGVRIALVDDVITTGSTIAEAARCCLAAGAASVEAWAIARTP